MSQKFKGIKCRRSVLGAATAPTLIKTLNFMKRRGDSAKICKYAIKRKLPSLLPLLVARWSSPSPGQGEISKRANLLLLPRFLFHQIFPDRQRRVPPPTFTYEPTASAVLLLVLTNRSSLSNVSFLTSNKDEISPYRKRRE